MRRVVVVALAASLALGGLPALPASAAAPSDIRRLPLRDADDMSDDGRFVAFTSTDARVRGDTNRVADVFVLDLVTRAIERVSVSRSERQGNEASGEAAISADGRYVAFTSSATNLVPEDTNAAADVFLRDRAAGTTIRVSVKNGGAQARGPSFGPSLSGDGHDIAFRSSASNLGAPLDEGVFVRDRDAGTTTLLGSIDDGSFDGLGGRTEMSADGRFVLWEGGESGAEGGCVKSSLLVRDRARSTTERHEDSCGSIGDFGVSADGRFVGWSWTPRPNATTWGADPAEGTLLDRETGIVSFPGDGLVVAAGGARAFTGGDALRAYDTAGQRTELLRVAAAHPFVPIDATASGDRVLVQTSAPNLVDGDSAITPDVFLVDAGTPPPTPLIAHGRDIAVQPGTGDLVVAATVEDPSGDLDVAVLRYTPSGAPDTTFGGDGIEMLDVPWHSVEARAVAVQRDGSILVGVQEIDDILSPSARIVRLTPTGALDATFADGGTLLLEDSLLADVLVLRRGRIVVSSTALFGGSYSCEFSPWRAYDCVGVAVRRYTSDGTADRSFAGGEVRVDYGFDGGWGLDLFAGEIATNDGDYYVVTSEGVIRITGAGGHDTAFGSDGQAVAGFADSDCLFASNQDRLGDIVVSNGAPVVAMGDADRFCATRFTDDGQPDPAFGTGGTAVVPVTTGTLPNRSAALTEIAADAKDRIILGGWADEGMAQPDIVVARLTSTGQPDATFASDGRANVEASPGGWCEAAGLVLSSASPVLVGTAAPAWDRSLEVALVKLTSDGSPDGSFGDGDGRLTTPFSG